jgi:glutathione S-transferase
VLTLFQAEWCPYSAAVRERLTELGVDFVARQVAPWPEQRVDVDEIPTLETDDGTRISGTREIFDHLRGYEAGPFAADHRARYAEHRQARERDATGAILAKASPVDERATP